MQKLLVFKVLAGALVVSSVALHAAAEIGAEIEQEKWVIPAMQGWNLHRACSDYNLPEIERLLDEGATDIPGCSNLLNAIMSDKQESLAVVEFLIGKGGSVADVGGSNPLECALSWKMPFEQKKAKVEALLNAGVYVDWDKIDKTIKQAQAAEKKNNWPEHVKALVHEQWTELIYLIAAKAIKGQEFSQTVYPVLLEKLPVDGVADLAGQYMHPYWGGRNQALEAMQGLEDGGQNQESESVQEQKDGD